MRCTVSFSHAAIGTEKLPAPDPTAERTPSETMRPKPEVMNGVNAMPMASTTRPAMRIFEGPTIRYSARDRLDDAPHQLRDGKRKADGGDAEPG
jgi:hypothetical protein